MREDRSNVWTEAEAAADPRGLFAAVLSSGPQRVRMPNLADIVLTLDQTDEDAEKSLAALLKRPNFREESE